MSVDCKMIDIDPKRSSRKSSDLVEVGDSVPNGRSREGKIV